MGLAALLFARNIDVPLVYTFHTLFPRYVHHAPFIPQRPAKAVISAYLSFFCGQAAAVIVPSEMVRRYVSLMKTKAQIEVVPTGINLEQIKEKMGEGLRHAEIRRQHKLPSDARILLYCGRLSEEKNVPFLLKAFDLIRSRLKNVYLVLVGGGPKEEEYKRSAGERVIFAGEKKHLEVLDYYLASELFVYASVTETQGLVLAEAKACGLPAVAVFGGGISDVVRNGIDGYVVPRNLDQFVEHVLRILRDEDLRIKMSHLAVEDAQNRFSSVGVAKRVESIYNSLVTN